MERRVMMLGGSELILLEQVFKELCEYLNGKLKWSGGRTRFTKVFLGFFSNLANQKENIRGEQNYLTIDYVWHYETTSHHLELTVEHENKCKINDFLSKEIQHLIDVKADSKIAITYPTLGEEIDLIERIRNRIKRSARRLSTSENYLVIFGFSTTKSKKGRKRRAIKFNAYYIDQDGKLLKRDEKVIFQGPKTFNLRVEAFDASTGRQLRIPFQIQKLPAKGTEAYSH